MKAPLFRKSFDGMSLACSDANVGNPLPGSSKEVPPFRYVTATPATLKAKKDRRPLLRNSNQRYLALAHSMPFPKSYSKEKEF